MVIVCLCLIVILHISERHIKYWRVINDILRSSSYQWGISLYLRNPEEEGFSIHPPHVDSGRQQVCVSVDVHAHVRLNVVVSARMCMHTFTHC